MTFLAYVVLACASFWVALALIYPRVAATILVAGSFGLLIVAAMDHFHHPTDEQ